MTLRILPLLCIIVICRCAAQTEESSGISDLISDHSLGGALPSDTTGRPRADLKRIINTSNSFLKEKEPEMTSEEYALYQKVVAVLNSSPELAITMLEGMMNDKEPPSPAFEFMLGNAYYTAGHYDKAEPRYHGALKRFPSFLRAWTNLGVLYYSMERYRDGVPCFAKAIALGDRDPVTSGLMAYCLEKTGDIVPSEMAYLQAMGADPKNVSWKEGLARLYIESEQFARAQPLVKALIREHPDEGRYWLMYAHILLSQDKKVKAIAVLELAARAKVAGPEELTLLGDLLAEQQLTTEALTIYEQLLAADALSGERKLLQYAEVLTGAQKYAQAADVLKSVGRKLSPEGRLLFLQTTANLAMAQKQWAEARKAVDELLKIDPLNGRALLSLGKTYAMEGDYAHATFAFQSALNLSGTAYRACLELADLELKRRHYQEGAKHLENALKLERSEAVENLLAQAKNLAGGESVVER